MSKKLRKLSLTIKDQNPEEAILVYCDLIKHNTPIKDIVFSILKDTIPILYRNKYFNVPHGFMGISAAIDLSSYVDDPSLPLAQAIWYLAQENKLAPLDFSVYTPLYLESEDKMAVLENYVIDGDVPKSYRYFLSLLAQSGITPEIKANILNMALKDTVNSGHKAIYTMEIFELVDYLGMEPPNIFYPSISYLASEPKEFKIFDLAKKEFDNFIKEYPDAIQNSELLSEDEVCYLIKIIIESMKPRVVAFITTLLQQGKSINSIGDAITLAASQLVLDTDIDDWLLPLHGFNYCHAVNWWRRNFNNEEQILSLYMQALFIHYLSVAHKKVHFTGLPVYVKHRSILNNLLRSIITSNVSDTVSLTQSYLMSGGDSVALIKELVKLTTENDTISNHIHDLKFTSTCLKEYQHNTSPNKSLILVALSKHLSQSIKEYSCFNHYKACLTKTT